LSTFITNLIEIKSLALAKENENQQFQILLKELDTDQLDSAVFELNEQISTAIDCTQCGNCCRSFMINVEEQEIAVAADFLEESTANFIEKYIEVGSSGRMIINTIPCHFLSEKKCTIYTARFSGCREFPHLHEPGFSKRLFTMFQYYSICPIIFNVLEGLKLKMADLQAKRPLN
jgi:Fe-S-cluster containining protein